MFINHRESAVSIDLGATNTFQQVGGFACVCSIKLEKAMAPHSSTLAWKIPRTEEPGRLQSMGLLGVGHD